MLKLCLEICEKINSEIRTITVSENFFNLDQNQPRGFEAYRQMIQAHIVNLPAQIQVRLNEEYFGYGPLDALLAEESTTEIIINQFDSLWLETNGTLHQSPDCFLSEHTYEHFLQRLYLEIGQEPTLVSPFVDGYWRGHRLHVVGIYQSGQASVRITIRKHKATTWSLANLKDNQWASQSELQYLQQMIEDRKNFLVIGPTGSGKTSVLKALLNECRPTERVVILEDSREIEPPTEASTRLVCRHDNRNVVTPINLTDLVKQCLRMRPDRIVIGEVRGEEAKDLLMALATGHDGSASTLHASDAHQALVRLEMLIQMGAPQWNLHAIRRLIQLSIDRIIVCSRQKCGQRRLNGIYKMISLEISGLILERIEF